MTLHHNNIGHRRRLGTVVAVALALVAAAAVPANALGSKPDDRRSRRLPRVFVGRAMKAGAGSGIVFSEEVATISVRGLGNRVVEARVDRVLHDYVVARQREFEQALPDYSTSYQPQLDLSVSVESAFASRAVTSVLFRQIVSGTALAHPFTQYDAFTFDRHGRQVDQSALLRPGGAGELARVASPLATTILASRGDTACHSDAPTLASLLSESNGRYAAHLAITKTGLLTAFDDYSFGFYYCGTATITIPYRQLHHVVRPEFVPVGTHDETDAR
jgi:hypothetical protein